MNRFVRTLGNGLDRIGFRRLVALAATTAYRTRPGPRRRFSVTSDGEWVNQQAPGTIVSPTIHTEAFEAVESNALDLWAWQYRPQPGDNVMDIGAGIGEESLVFSKLVGDQGMVISIEANPKTFASLSKTIALSGAANVRTAQLAIAAEDGIIKISNTTDHVTNSLFSDSASVDVQARSMDSLVEDLGLDTLSLVKMNIEGAEALAVQGMAKVADRIRHVVISCHDFITEAGGSEDYRTFDHVRAVLHRLGFETSVRSDDPRPWVRYNVYGRNLRRE